MKTNYNLITGSTFWNPGDDLVRHGVMSLFDYVDRSRATNCYGLYSFSQPTISGHLGENPNLICDCDVRRHAKMADRIIVPGLAVGVELRNFLTEVANADCTHKLHFIGGMNSNQYCRDHAALVASFGVFRHARVIISRTREYPEQFNAVNGGVHVLPCPSIFGDNVDDPGDFDSRDRILFSIQLPEPYGIENHKCSHDAANAALKAMRAVAEIYPGKVDLVCHHKTEYEMHRFAGIAGVRFLFFSEQERIRDAYKKAVLVVSTRLHAVLWGHALGVPGVVVNDSERHRSALEQYPHVPIKLGADGIVAKAVELYADRDGAFDSLAAKIDHFRHATLDKYEQVLKSL